jgi:hypothetical protein
MNILYYILSCLFCLDDEYYEIEYIIDDVLDLDLVPYEISYEKN